MPHSSPVPNLKVRLRIVSRRGAWKPEICVFAGAARMRITARCGGVAGVSIREIKSASRRAQLVGSRSAANLLTLQAFGSLRSIPSSPPTSWTGTRDLFQLSKQYLINTNEGRDPACSINCVINKGMCQCTQKPGPIISRCQNPACSNC